MVFQSCFFLGGGEVAPFVPYAYAYTDLRTKDVLKDSSSLRMNTTSGELSDNLAT